MYRMNRVSLVGTTVAQPQIYDVGGNKRLMVMDVITEILDANCDQESFRQHLHKIAVEEPLLIEYAHSFILPGDLVFVEGQLEHLTKDSETWIVVTEPHGLLHLLSRSVQSRKKGVAAFPPNG